MFQMNTMYIYTAYSKNNTNISPLCVSGRASISLPVNFMLKQSIVHVPFDQTWRVGIIQLIEAEWRIYTSVI